MDTSTPQEGSSEPPERWSLRPVRRRDKLLGVAFGVTLALVAIGAIWVFEGSVAFTAEGPR